MGMKTSFNISIKGSDSKEYEFMTELKEPESGIKAFLKSEGLESLTDAVINCFDKALRSYEKSEEQRIQYIKKEFPSLEWEWELNENRGSWAEEITVKAHEYEIMSSVTGDDYVDGRLWEKYFSDVKVGME